MSKKTLLALAFAALLPSVALAGSHYVSIPTCSKYADGSGVCYGSYEMFRNSSDASAAVEFFEESVGGSIYRSFYATVQNVSYSCSPNASVSAIWDHALASRGLFFITWDTTGTCNVLELANGSQFGTTY